MDQTEETLDTQQKQLEEQLAKLPKKRWGILKLVAVGLISPFILPYIPLRRGTLAERMGYTDAVLLFGLIFIIVVPFACYKHIQKINNQKHDIEFDLQRLKRKQQQNKEAENI